MDDSAPPTPMSTQNLEVRVTSWKDPDGALLRLRQLEETLSEWPNEPIPPASLDPLPTVVVLLKEGRAVACGGLQPLSTRIAELRRFYVVPEWRGRQHGVSDFLLQQLEEEALKRGYTTLTLELGIELRRARAFSERHGFVQIPLYGPYIGAEGISVCYEKKLLNPP
ncbi:unnamed protein product [Cercospora beticola]|nr:unnamed protein product [Cercospora beticola]